jgi:hypothetical protein
MVCGVNTSEIGEYYMVRDEVWLRAMPGKLGMLCVECLEGCLGRKLRPDDFDEDWKAATLNVTPHSDLLLARVFGHASYFEREER